MIRGSQSVVIAAFTEEQAVSLTGVTLRQLRYWAADGFFVPSLSYPGDDDGLPSMRLYSFRDLVCLKVIGRIRNEAEVPMGELRRAKTRLQHLGVDLWAKTTLFIFNKKIVFADPYSGHLQEAVSGQGVLEIPLMIVSGNMEEAVRLMRQRNAQNIGRVDTKKTGKKNPVVAGTRIPIRTIHSFIDDGYTAEQIIKQFPTLTSEDIKAVIAFREAS